MELLQYGLRKAENSFDLLLEMAENDIGRLKNLILRATEIGIWLEAFKTCDFTKNDLEEIGQRLKKMLERFPYTKEKIIQNRDQAHFARQNVVSKSQKYADKARGWNFLLDMHHGIEETWKALSKGIET